jgi:homoserine O-acetyltransferase
MLHVNDINVFTIYNFTLESGVVIPTCPIAYQTWGSLNSQRDNVVVVCHALSGSSNVEEWWSNLFGIGKSLDPSKYFIFCANVLGSPYGSASPLTINSTTLQAYGPDFPVTSPRDDVVAMKVVLDTLNISRIHAVIGGSMGGMHVLEWSFYNDYVLKLIPIATSGKTSAWCIAWNETQRLTICLDPNYKNGHYNVLEQPCLGLAVARMNALLTYRTHESFEKRFGRNVYLFYNFRKI